MEQIYFGARIAQKRKELGLTQETLAQRLGVSNQAVSKWESDQCCPDIMLLPDLADTFEISIDELFGRESAAKEPAPQAGSAAADLPWEDDGSLRAVCYVGRRLVDYADLEKRPAVSVFGSRGEAVTLHFSGSVRDIHSAFGVVIQQSEVSGSVYAQDSVSVEGGVGGDVTAGDGVTCGNVEGNVDAGDSVRCGSVEGSVEAGDSVRCGSVGGSVTAGDSVSCFGVGGDIKAEKVVCNSRG